MTIRDIRLFGDPVLTTRAEEVSSFDDSLRATVEDMLATMDDAGGVGLAANQVGLTKRVFVFDTTGVQSGLRGHVINPVWEPIGADTQLGSEGCLSIPDISMDTERYQRVHLRGRDVEHRPISVVASGLLARCIQHETDHLDGVLFLKRLEPDLKKQAMATIRTSGWFNN